MDVLDRIEKGVLRLTENQTVLQDSLIETQEVVRETRKAMRALDEKTDERIAKLVRAIVELSKQRRNGSKK
jgi:predicted  nucleic acid-binding Zn-ribbon protein